MSIRKLRNLGDSWFGAVAGFRSRNPIKDSTQLASLARTNATSPSTRLVFRIGNVHFTVKTAIDAPISSLIPTTETTSKRGSEVNQCAQIGGKILVHESSQASML